MIRIRHIALALATCIAAAAPAAAQIVRAVDAIGITVADINRSLPLYTDVLGFEPVSDIEVAGEDYEHLLGVFGARLRVMRLRLGDEFIELIDYLAPEGRPIPVDSRSNDRWFQHIAIVVSDMNRAYALLRAHKVQHASTGPQTLPEWNPAAGGIRAFYFKDPDGNHLELIQFPPGKGDARWQHPDGRLFLGIDHTAIVVDDTDAALTFYRDRLGLRVVGESENYGTEQEHLNNVFGARLRITALRSDAGPGIEFLEYLAPAGGRSTPVDTNANDLWHWQVNLIAPDMAGLWSALRAGHASAVSPGPVNIVGAALGYNQGLMARDGDGHALLFIQRRQSAAR